MTGAAESEAGTTLIEVLVAFVILTGTIIVGYQIFGDGLHRIAQAETRAELAVDARSAIDALPALNPGMFRSMSSNGRMLTISVAPLVRDGESQSGARPLRVQIWDGEASDGSAIADTIVIGPAPQ